jgi:hypothetical protein
MFMANKAQLSILKQGVEVWNKWREKDPYKAMLNFVLYFCLVSIDEQYSVPRLEIEKSMANDILKQGIWLGRQDTTNSPNTEKNGAANETSENSNGT